MVEAALGRGHEVTLFNRGQTNPDLFPEAEKLRGDRDGDLSALKDREWDAVVDTSGYFPRIVRASAEALAGSRHYTFVSSISVYADLSVPPTESSPVGTLEDQTVEDFGEEFVNYGPLKALCERAVNEVFRDRALVVRPGYIVGPHDPTDRFTYWPHRVARGGEMIAPASPDQAFQFVDVRDLAGWMLRMIEAGAAGAFNATGEAVPLADLLAACPGGAEITWVSAEFLEEHGVGEEELPLWTHDPEFAAIHRADVSKAVAAGLSFRSVEQTARDTLAWAGDRELVVGMRPDREAELLAAWRAR
jgi:2'-hydroxyisoflavone reductase